MPSVDTVNVFGMTSSEEGGRIFDCTIDEFRNIYSRLERSK
jgi:hypothetical protein